MPEGEPQDLFRCREPGRSAALSIVGLRPFRLAQRAVIGGFWVTGEAQQLRSV
jgi:hypothetical protein